jgi:opacity protein-like surface antigen
MKRTIISVAILGLTAITSSSALAQAAAPSRPVQFGVMGGVSIPVSDFSDGAKTGWNAGALLNFGMANSPLGFRVDGQWHEFKAKGDIGAKFRVIDGTADVVFNFGGVSPLKVYLIGGGGVYNFHTSFDDSSLSSDSETKFGLNGGAGVKFQLGSLATFVEGRYHYVFLHGSDFENNSSNPKLQMIPISVGITF